MKTLAERLNLAPGDVLIVPKSALNIVKHMVVFWGYDNTGLDFYLENNQLLGVRYLTGEEVTNIYHIIAIRKFTGSEQERLMAIQRAESLIGRAYNLTNFNCEHYANYVQYGTSFSNQINAGVALTVSTLGLVVLSRIFQR